MMGQELFEHPHRQYREYGITALTELSSRIGDPEDPNMDAMEEALANSPEDAITFDDDTDLWITGPDEAIEAMFDDREAFVAALLEDVDPGL